MSAAKAPNSKMQMPQLSRRVDTPPDVLHEASASTPRQRSPYVDYVRMFTPEGGIHLLPEIFDEAVERDFANLAWISLTGLNFEPVAGKTPLHLSRRALCFIRRAFDVFLSMIFFGGSWFNE
jgi:hypothetical protein